MKTLSVLVMLTLAAAWTATAVVPQMINYQGRLTDSSGDPVDDTVSIVFTICADSLGGACAWTELHSSVPVSNGLFNVVLGSTMAIESDIFSGPERWLGITVDGEAMPYTRFVTVPYAYHTAAADTAAYALAGPGSGSCSWYVLDSVLYTDMNWGIAKGNADNALYGNYAHSMVNLGEACTTGADGVDYNYCTVSGGYGNSATWISTVGGGTNNAAAVIGTVGGGRDNVAGERATVSGGEANTADGYLSAIGGGAWNVAGTYGTVAGGYGNEADTHYAAICGGFLNGAKNHGSCVLGGTFNFAGGDHSTILGGFADTLWPDAIYSMAYGRNIHLSDGYRVVLYEGDHSGRLGLNRDDDDGGIQHPIHVGTNATNGNGAHLTAGGVWTNGSSRRFKEDFQSLDGAEILDHIDNLPIESWQYQGTGERHIWPCSEDFYKAFNVGAMRDDGSRETRYLAAGDVAGVAMVGVQELSRQLKAKSKRVEDLEARVIQLEAMLETVLANQGQTDQRGTAIGMTVQDH